MVISLRLFNHIVKKSYIFHFFWISQIYGVNLQFKTRKKDEG